MCSILRNVLRVLEKNVDSSGAVVHSVHSGAVEYRIFYMSIRFTFSYSVIWVCCFLISFLSGLSNLEGAVSKFLNITVLFSVTPLRLLHACVEYLVVPMLGAYIFAIIMPSWQTDPFITL